jgi:hypothetical protein
VLAFLVLQQSEWSSEVFLFDKDADLCYNKACQSTGWNKKGHKADCKLLKDTDLNGLFSLDWDNFKGHIGFPLNSVTIRERSGLVLSK